MRLCFVLNCSTFITALERCEPFYKTVCYANIWSGVTEDAIGIPGRIW